MLNRNIYTTVTNQNVDALFALPEKVLQFGTGVLLRGLPDYFIDKANKQGLVIESLPNSSLTASVIAIFTPSKYRWGYLSRY